MDISDWQEHSSNGDFTAVDGQGRLYVQAGVSGYAAALYKYRLPNLDFSFDISLANYDPDSVINGLYARLSITGSNTEFSYATCSNIAQCTVRQIDDDFPNYLIGIRFKVNNTSYTEITTESSTLPSKFRLRRIGTTIYMDYYTTFWETLGSRDFGAYASQPRNIYAVAASNSNNGGRWDFDNLIFHEGCPTGSDLAWT